jgi:hypothetical protein
MTDYTTDHRINLETYLASHVLSCGLGKEESACTLAAINLAMSGRLTDAIPVCMSAVLGKAAIDLQDAMPNEMRNSQRYKSIIPDMPGTGRALEQERLSIMLDWMWSVVLPQIQPIADNGGFGVEWRLMCHDRTADAAARAADAAADAARAAAAAAYAAVDAAVAAAAHAADAARAAARAAAWAATWAAHAGADAARAAARAADARAYAAAYAAVDAAAHYAASYDARAYAADARAYAAARADFWTAIDPIGVLERMTYLTGAKP